MLWNVCILKFNFVYWSPWRKRIIRMKVWPFNATLLFLSICNGLKKAHKSNDLRSKIFNSLLVSRKISLEGQKLYHLHVLYTSWCKILLMVSAPMLDEVGRYQLAPFDNPLTSDGSGILKTSSRLVLITSNINHRCATMQLPGCDAKTLSQSKGELNFMHDESICSISYVLISV